MKSWVLIILEWTLWNPGVFSDICIASGTTEVSIPFSLLSQPCLRYVWFVCFGCVVRHVGCLLPDQGIKPVPPASEAQSPNHWTTKEVPLYFLNFYLGCMCAQSLSHVWLFATPWTVAHQPPLSMRFARQEYWNGLPCPPPGDLLSQESNPCLLHCRQILDLRAIWEAPSLYF